jgi:hypothetical protein
LRFPTDGKIAKEIEWLPNHALKISKSNLFSVLGKKENNCPDTNITVKTTKYNSIITSG